MGGPQRKQLRKAGSAARAPGKKQVELAGFYPFPELVGLPLPPTPDPTQTGDLRGGQTQLPQMDHLAVGEGLS